MDNLEASKQADLSLLRIAATLAVVFLHTNNTLSNNSTQFSLTEEQVIFFTTNNLLMNWAVPVFLMISGTLLLDPSRQITFRICVNKYVKRILLALFIFGVPFSILEIVLNVKTINAEIVLEAIINVINGNSWSHLWYLYSLIGLYLILPILKAFVNNSDDNAVLYSVGVTFLFCFVVKWIDKISGMTIAFGLPITGFTVFYVLAGRYIYTKSHLLKKKKYFMILLALEIVSIAIESIYHYPECKNLLSYDSPIIASLAITVFVLFIGLTTTKVEFVWNIDRLCFGVYLIHPVFINFMYKFLKFTPAKFEGIYPVATFVFWMFFVSASFIGSWIMYQVPVLKKYVL